MKYSGYKVWAVQRCRRGRVPPLLPLLSQLERYDTFSVCTISLWCLAHNSLDHDGGNSAHLLAHK